MITRMYHIILVLIFFIIESCSLLPESRGKSNEIIVITSQEDKVFIEPLLSNLFSHIIHTPQGEKDFILKYRNPWEFTKYEQFSNILVTSIAFPRDSTGDVLMQRILNQHNQDANLLTLGDLYAKNQLICLIHAQDAIDFGNIIQTNSKWLLDEYNTHFELKIKDQIFKYGKNYELSNRILNILGYTLDLQPDFKLIKSDSLHNFVWLGRGIPYRWITLHKSNRDKYIHLQSSWEQLIKDFSINMPEVIISNNFQINEKVYYGEQQIPVMRGLYEHLPSESGGPFFVYIFDTEQTNEVILISGFVNYPGHEKLLLLKQLEIMAKTLHKGELE